MNRAECEARIAKKLKEIIDIYAQYNPEGKYLSLTIFPKHSIQFWNQNYDDDTIDVEYPIDYWERFDKEDNKDEN